MIQAENHDSALDATSYITLRKTVEMYRCVRACVRVNRLFLVSTHLPKPTFQQELEEGNYTQTHSHTHTHTYIHTHPLTHTHSPTHTLHVLLHAKQNPVLTPDLARGLFWLFIKVVWFNERDQKTRSYAIGSYTYSACPGPALWGELPTKPTHSQLLL